MGKRNGQHDYLPRVPDGSWAEFCALVQTLRPKRSASQQIVQFAHMTMRHAEWNRRRLQHR
jgi:hypothetical protein